MFTLWSNLDIRRRIIVILSTVAVFVAVLMLSRMVSAPGMALLYAGLDNRQAGEVIAALDQRGALYDVRGESIFVEERLRDQLRMTLAGEGLPANTGAGYELLDGLSGFGTTSQMFDAAYWRAKEGELARTIVAGPGVRQARVHISNPSSSPFQRDSKPTASVTVTSSGEPLTEARAQALRYLVASAVAGLDATDVAIIDAVTGRVIDGTATPEAAAAGNDRGSALKANVQRLLEARVGPGNAIVELSLETVTDRESIVERRFDPEGRVAISTDTEERSSSSTNGGGEAVTVASNVPSGDAGESGRNEQSQESEVRERTNYEVSETKREILRAPGAVKRLTVAVLVNDVVEPGPDGAPSRRARDEAELEVLRELVASAVGYDEARGDVITLKSMAFEPPATLGTGPTVGLIDRLGLDMMRLVQLGVLSLVTLALGLFVIRPILAGRRETAEATGLALPPMAPELEGSVEAIGDASGADAGGLPALADIGGMADGLPAMGTITDFDFGEDGGMPSLDDDPVGHLKQLIEDRQPDTIEILKTWLEDDTRETA